MGRKLSILLSYEGHRALVSDFGASLRRYSVNQKNDGERHLLWGYSETTEKKGGQGDVLIPFPGRIRKGHYRFNGLDQQLKQNDKDGPNAIHGFLRGATWELLERTEAMVRFGFQLREERYRDEGYPFSLDIEVAYALSQNGLRCDFKITNVGAEVAPVGAGFHPYFLVGDEAVDEWEVSIPANRLIEFGSDLLPTGKRLGVAGGPWDYREPKSVGATRFNHCYTSLKRDIDGLARVRLRNPRSSTEVTVWMDEAFEYLVIYTGDTIPAPNARRALAIEPMTCATDAFNHPEWGLRTLIPGGTFSGSWGVS